jgi:hypothetical protein
MPHLEESVRLESSPLGWFNLALAYRGAGRIAAAVNAFERYLAAPEPEAPAVRLAAIRGELIGLLRSVARLQVSVTPPSATIRVDGREATMSNGELRVDPGTHAIAFEAPGYEPSRREVNLQAGATVVLDLQLHPIAPVAAAQPLAVPLTIAVAPPAPTVRERPDGTSSRPVQLQAGNAERLNASVMPQSQGRGWVLPVVIASGAAVVTAVVIGVAFATRGMATPTQGSWDTRQEP